MWSRLGLPARLPILWNGTGQCEHARLAFRERNRAKMDVVDSMRHSGFGALLLSARLVLWSAPCSSGCPTRSLRRCVATIVRSGTYVRASRVADGLLFGLLIPDLGETEIFEPCRGSGERAGGWPALRCYGVTSSGPAPQRKSKLSSFAANSSPGVFPGCFLRPWSSHRQATIPTTPLCLSSRKGAFPSCSWTAASCHSRGDAGMTWSASITAVPGT